MNKIVLLKDCIIKVPLDAIVNAANTSLLGGGVHNGVIHRAGGPAIQAECQNIRNRQGGCKVRDAVITTAGDLPAKYVINTVGPHWQDGQHDEETLLKNAYLSCFKLVEEYDIQTVSFPNISTGIYRFPKVLAAEIALGVINQCLRDNQNIEQVNLVCFDDDNYVLYSKILGQ